jgi:hypothetical protein
VCLTLLLLVQVLAFTKEDEAVVKGMIRDELDSNLGKSAARFDQLTADVQELKLGVKLVQSELKLQIEVKSTAGSVYWQTCIQRSMALSSSTAAAIQWK